MPKKLLIHRLSVAFVSVVVTALSACSSSTPEGSEVAPISGGASASGGNGPSSTGGVTGNGGSSAVGGVPAGGTATGGMATGGMATGGMATGGSATGGVTSTTGGATNSVGGAAVGGKATGGSTSPGTGGSSGSSTTGGKATGGSTSPGTGGGSGSSTTCTTDEEKKFSFFLLSQAALQKDSGQVDGYGGDLGGLSGADAICQRVAEKSSACQKSKTWHAFLSTATVNAKDRIGTGPWYDRLGRLMATNLTNLLTERPTGADVAIVNDFPNEDGVPNHSPEGTQVDNHEILTGTGVDGKVYTQSSSSGGGFGDTACGPMTGTPETWTVEAATCWGWTSKEAKGCPRVGHSWPRQGSGIGWISVWNESGCAPGGTLSETMMTDGRRVVGSYGGYGGFYCFAVTGQ